MRKARTVELTAEIVRQMLDYDPESGDLTWKIERYRKHPGEIAGCKYLTSKKRHRTTNISINYKRYLAHRIIWLWMTGEWPDGEIDHKDGDGWNNKWSNLRVGPHSKNGKNLKIKITNKTGVSGVCTSKRGKFRARIMVDRKDIHLGEFDTIEQAAAARKLAEDKYFGEWARNA